ncbi:MAG: hypothetical protein ACTH8F_07545 [Microbacterium sp.]|uniref:hypothetical protein n=1 Tax=Microbacterium sp. TaxID=51671 RepID=UPI003F9497EC
MKVKFLRWKNGIGTVLDTGDVIERVKTSGRRDRLTIRNALGEEYTVTDHPDYVTREPTPGATIATAEGVVIATTAHHTLEY